MQSASDASQAAKDVLRAVSDGEITPNEATRVTGLINSYKRTPELTDIETRIAALEADLANSALKAFQHPSKGSKQTEP